ncbi:MAG: hypothetical protein L6V91_05625 [Bacilli bacterium]|nr:MAG: hypothetical protein L6V91_05625 [Bacilli bacterium]
MDLIVVTIRDSDDWNTHIDLYNYAKDNYIGYRVLNKKISLKYMVIVIIKMILFILKMIFIYL